MHSAATSIADRDPQSDSYIVRSKFFYKFTRGVYAAIEMHVRATGKTPKQRDKLRDKLHRALHYLQVACVQCEGAGIATRAELEHRLTQIKWHNHEGPKFSVREFRDLIRLFKRLGLLSEKQRGIIVFEFWEANQHKNYPTQPQVNEICKESRDKNAERQRRFRARNGSKPRNFSQPKSLVNQAVMEPVTPPLSQDSRQEGEDDHDFMHAPPPFEVIRAAEDAHIAAHMHHHGESEEMVVAWLRKVRSCLVPRTALHRPHLPESLHKVLLASELTCDMRHFIVEQWSSHPEHAHTAPMTESLTAPALSPVRNQFCADPADGEPAQIEEPLSQAVVEKPVSQDASPPTESLTPPCHTGPDAAPRQNDEFEQEHRSVVPAQNDDKHVTQNEQRDDPEEKTPSGVAVDKFEQGHAPDPSIEGTNPHPEGSEAWYTFEGEVMCRKLRARGDT